MQLAGTVPRHTQNGWRKHRTIARFNIVCQVSTTCGAHDLMRRVRCSRACSAASPSTKAATSMAHTSSWHGPDRVASASCSPHWAPLIRTGSEPVSAGRTISFSRSPTRVRFPTWLRGETTPTRSTPTRISVCASYCTHRSPADAVSGGDRRSRRMPDRGSLRSTADTDRRGR